MSSVTLRVEHSKSKFPFKAIGLVLVGLSLLGFIYAFYPPTTNAVEIDLGSELQVLSSAESAVNSFTAPVQEDSPAFLIKAGWIQPALQTPFTCEIRGVPDSILEGRTTLKPEYFCNGKQLEPERLKPIWTISAGRVELKNASSLEIDATGFGSQRLILSVSFRGCGQRPCQKRWTIAVTKPKYRMVVRVLDDAGQAVPQAMVTLNQVTRKRTDPRGVAQFPDLEPGNYSIAVLATGFKEFTTTQELKSGAVIVRAPLVRIQAASPSPVISPSPTPPASPSPTPTLSPSPSPTAAPSPSPSAEASASPEYSPSESPAPSPVVTQAETIFAPGKNGSLTISWPTTVSRGWSNVCRIRYVPPPSLMNHNVQAAFSLTPISGLADTNLRSGFQPLDQAARDWNIPLEPAGADGSVVRAQLMMTLRIGSESNATEIQLQPLQSTIDDKPLTKNQTLGGSALSGLLGAGFFGVGRTKRKDASEGTGMRVGSRYRGRHLPKDFPRSDDVTLSAPSGGLASSIKEWFEDRLTKSAESRSSQPPQSAKPPVPVPAQPSAPPAPVPAQPPAPPKPGPDVLEKTLGLETPDAEAPRYVDVAIYEDHLFEPEDLEGARKVSDDVPLIAHEPYTLEVAVRQKRTGIQSDLPAGREVDNPREEQETLTIHILVTPRRGFEIKDSLVTISWPFNADSDSALFRLDVEEPGDRTRPGSLEIRILDDSLNLLDIVTLKVGIVADKGEELDAGVPLRDLKWPETQAESLSLAGQSEPRLASITVHQKTGGYNFEFVMHSAKGEAVNISIFRDITTDDLRNLLRNIREFWTQLVISNYARKLAVSKPTYEGYLRDLRELGIQAWLMLFDTRTFAKQGASERLGQIIARLEPGSTSDTDKGDRIQIAYADETNFIFPWSILHPPVPDDNPVDPLRFWGARYQIEQITKGPLKDRITDRPVNVLFALDSNFGDAPSQKKMFEDYAAASKGELVVSSPISDRKTLQEFLIKTPAAHLAYFYCHGYAATLPGLMTSDGVKSLQTIIKNIREKETDPDPLTASALEKFLELTSKMGGDAWIYLGDAEVKEAELRRLNFFGGRRPIVFLNMCQSADLVPSMSSGLVHLFLDHNASAVVGTESPMTGVFADVFAKVVLDRLFAGDNIGTALWKARRHFLTKGRNPLGLAYTLYGRADATLGTKDRPFVIQTHESDS